MRCLDSTYLIDLQEGIEGAVNLARSWEENGERTAVPLPAYVEWLRGAYFCGGKFLAASMRLAENLEVLPISIDTGQDAARFGAETSRLGRALSSSDLLIAAIARHHHAVLVTRDSGFAGLPGLPVESY